MRYYLITLILNQQIVQESVAMKNNIINKQSSAFTFQAESVKLTGLMLKLCILLCLLIIQSCGTVPVNLHYKPLSKPAVLTDDRKLNIHIDRIIDRTGGPNSYGGDINEQLSLKGPLSTSIETPYIESLRQALEIEFERLGLPLMKQPEKADAILTATLLKTLAYVKSTGMVDVPVYGAFEFSLALKCPGSPTLWESEFNGYGKGLLSAPGYLRVGSGPNDAMNAAFADGIEQIGPKLRADKVVDLLTNKCINRP
jgi:hypothetical protein